MKRRSADSPASSLKTARCLDVTRIEPGAARCRRPLYRLCPARYARANGARSAVRPRQQHAEVGKYHLHLRCFTVWELERTKFP